jgi:hypothetical protein
MNTAAVVHDDIFSFDLPEDSPTSSHSPVSDPFDFGDSAPDPHQAGNVTMEDDMFGDLLESTPQTDAPSLTHQVSAATEKTIHSSSESGELDFDSFSWDDSPEAPAASGDDDTTDDFDSFFEDSKEKKSP